MLDATAGAGVGLSAGATTTHDADTVDATGLIAQATDARTGQVDTKALAADVAGAAQHDFSKASRAYGDIEQALQQQSPAEASRFNQDVRDAFVRFGGDAAAGLGVAAGRQGPKLGAAGTSRIAAGSELAAAGEARSAAGAAQSARGARMAGLGESLAAKGDKLLADNPILSKRWVSTRSAWTRGQGFTPRLRDMLEQSGIKVDDLVRRPPPGSIAKVPGQSPGVANNVNGSKARDAIADEYRAQGARVQVEHSEPAYGRRVDVRAGFPAEDPRYARVEDVESKVGRAGASRFNRAEVAKDARMLKDNAAIRARGEALSARGTAAQATGRSVSEAGAKASREGAAMSGAGRALEGEGRALATAGRAMDAAGKVLKPVAVAADAIQLGEAFHQDGNRVGLNTGRTASGVAGSWAGAAVGGEAGMEIGAAIGSVVPGAGTVIGGAVGGLVGGAIGGLGGDATGREAFNAGKKAFDAVASWF